MISLQDISISEPYLALDGPCGFGKHLWQIVATAPVGGKEFYVAEKFDLLEYSADEVKSIFTKEFVLPAFRRAEARLSA